MSVSVESATGDILVEPAAFSSRSGVLACRWNLAGIRPDLQLVAPFFQGVKLPLKNPLIKDSHWDWPFFWEAGLAISMTTRESPREYPGKAGLNLPGIMPKQKTYVWH